MPCLHVLPRRSFAARNCQDAQPRRCSRTGRRPVGSFDHQWQRSTRNWVAKQRARYRSACLEPVAVCEKSGDRQAPLKDEPKGRRDRQGCSAPSIRTPGHLGRSQSTPDADDAQYTSGPETTGFSEHQRPSIALGPIKCGACGSNYTKYGQSRFACAGLRDRGTCGNHLTVRGDEVEAAILDGLRARLMQPDLFEEFAREFTAEMNRQREPTRRA